MDKAELEKEVTRLRNENLDIINKYTRFAETDRRTIAELEAENEQIKNSDTLCKLIGEQKIKIAELEAQIEKMKCCENCRYCNEWGEANSNSPNCKKCNWVSNWKLRR